MRTWSLILTWAVVAAWPAVGAELPVLAREGWASTNAAGWTCFDAVNETSLAQCAVEGGSLGIKLGAQWMSMPPCEYQFRAGGGASGGQFCGDLMGRGVSVLRLRVYCAQPAAVTVLLRGATSGSYWRYAVGMVPGGMWTTVTAPVDARLPMNRRVNSSWAAFEQDLRDVAWVGVAFMRGDTTQAQEFRVDDVELAGAGPDFAGWMQQYATAGGNHLAGGDLDEDGVENYSEWVANTSATDSEDRLRVWVASRGDGGVDVRWPAREGRRYTVLQSSTMDGPFAPVPGAQDLGPAGATNTFTDGTAAGRGTSFYRVTVRKP